jgi:hypothetical protein
MVSDQTHCPVSFQRGGLPGLRAGRVHQDTRAAGPDQGRGVPAGAAVQAEPGGVAGGRAGDQAQDPAPGGGRGG